MASEVNDNIIRILTSITGLSGDVLRSAVEKSPVEFAALLEWAAFSQSLPKNYFIDGMRAVVKTDMYLLLRIRDETSKALGEFATNLLSPLLNTPLLPPIETNPTDFSCCMSPATFSHLFIHEILPKFYSTYEGNVNKDVRKPDVWWRLLLDHSKLLCFMDYISKWKVGWLLSQIQHSQLEFVSSQLVNVEDVDLGVWLSLVPKLLGQWENFIGGVCSSSAPQVGYVWWNILPLYMEKVNLTELQWQNLLSRRQFIEY